MIRLLILVAVALAGCSTTPPVASVAQTSEFSGPGSEHYLLDTSAPLVFAIRDAQYGSELEWKVPAPAPVLPSGKAAVRVSFLPLTCPAAGEFWIGATGSGEPDAWMAELNRADGGPTDLGAITCGDGATRLETGDVGPWSLSYLPLAENSVITVGVTGVGSNERSRAEVRLVPVYTDLDLELPAHASLGAGGAFWHEASGGAERPLPELATSAGEIEIGPLALADGAPAARLSLLVGCDVPNDSRSVLRLSYALGDGPKTQLAECVSNGRTGFLAFGSLPMPTAPTRLAVFAEGATTATAFDVVVLASR